MTGNVTGDLRGDVVGNVAGGITITSMESNFNTYPIVVAADTTPDGGTENLGASSKIKANGRSGYIVAARYIGENNSHMGYTSSIFITPDQFSEVLPTQRRFLAMNISGSHVSSSAPDGAYYVHNFQVPKGSLPQKVGVFISNAHLTKQVKVFANKINDGTTGLLLHETSTGAHAAFGPSQITYTKVLGNALYMADGTDNPYYYTLSVGPLSAGDQIWGGIIKHG